MRKSNQRIILALYIVTALSLSAEIFPKPAEFSQKTAISASSTLIWQTDYSAAAAQAKASNRHIMLFFTGSDWCSWCKRLNQEILSTPEFAKYATDKLVLVEVDFPKKRRQSKALKSQNVKLADRFQIELYPTLIVLDSSGEKIGQLGYQEGGPLPFVEKLGKL